MTTDKSAASTHRRNTPSETARCTMARRTTSAAEKRPGAERSQDEPLEQGPPQLRGPAGTDAAAHRERRRDDERGQDPQVPRLIDHRPAVPVLLENQRRRRPTRG